MLGQRLTTCQNLISLSSLIAIHIDLPMQMNLESDLLVPAGVQSVFITCKYTMRSIQGY